MRSVSLFFFSFFLLFYSALLNASDKILLCRVEPNRTDPCLVGSWKADKASYKEILEKLGHGLFSVESIAGDLLLNFDQYGEGKVEYRDFLVKTNSVFMVDTFYSYKGESEFRYSTEANNTKACSEVGQSNVEIAAWMIIRGERVDLPNVEGPLLGGDSFNYKCAGNEFFYEVNAGTEKLMWKFSR